MSQNRLFLLDAYALIFRGYYAFIKNPRINSKGLDTSAIMGFMNSLLDVIKRERPNYLAVAFDKAGSSARLEMYSEYKANRDETPEAIKIAVPYIQEILRAMHIPIIEVPGIEADDLIGTLAKQAEKEGFQVFMVTPDKDYAQLVSENIFMYKPARMGNGIEIWGVEYGSAKWGTSKDIEPYMDTGNFDNNVILTETERLQMKGRPKEPKYARNKNVLVIGGSGSGKTRFFCKPNLMQLHSSYVMTDPKGAVSVR